ncbi:KAP family P-loop NTPase fold protein [Nocardia noduli]|uniref:KAP family P-loop NTPase fold protein n=1 Tax=Nocardia noduli TaxID=2815722 RepID=UPI001C2220AC|nr:P-loop NTPase fold protein [Nocardia noduli]
MWADNEADVDLLGFDFLVDTLFVAVTESRLLPLTIGLLGDWGSGKSSLMALTCAELRAEGGPEQASPYLCVQFSPWQYEDYDDVKVALMNAILDAIDERVGDDAQAHEQVQQLRKRLPRLRRYGRKAARTILGAAPQWAPLAAQALDSNMDPALAGVIGDTLSAGARAGAERLADPVEPAVEEPVARERVTDVGSFRADFAHLVTELTDVKAVVVFIDDLDRCLPDTVVDTFEAIRLFVNTEKTAFVIAANEEIVQSAIDSRYPELVIEGTGLGAKYLEKMLQLRVSVPQLSPPEADTYMNLLLAQLHLEPEQFAKVIDKTRAIRAEGNLHVAFNLGICNEVVDDVPPALVNDLAWAASVSEILGGGLRGNPRQLKRFLNDLMLKHRSAVRRGITLQRPVLAKLMALEAQYLTDFQKLFGWQVQAQGPIPELAIAEVAAASEPAAAAAEPGSASGSRVGDEQPPRARRTRTSSQGQPESAAPQAGSDEAPPAGGEELHAWMNKPHVRAWLRLAPSLASTDLRPYFTYSRDKLSLGVAVARLPQHLQELLTKIQGDVAALRRDACQRIAALPSGERAQLVEALLYTLERQPGGPAFDAVLEIAGHCPDVVATICDKLLTLPASAVPLSKVPTAVNRLPTDNPNAVAVLEYWQNSGIPRLKAVVTAARDTPRQRGR